MLQSHFDVLISLERVAFVLPFILMLNGTVLCKREARL